jgi:hypothetical protein
LRRQFNEAADNFMAIEWWGHFNEIVEGRCSLGRDLVENFLDDGGAVSSVASDQRDEFVEYLRTSGV